MERIKWNRLIRRSDATDQPTDLSSEPVELEEDTAPPSDLASQLGADQFTPPGELVAFTTSVSKLTVLAVKRTNPWSVFWLVLISLVGGIGTLSMFLLTGVPAQIDCTKVSLLSTDSERLHCAKVATNTAPADQERAKVLAAIDLVDDWSSQHPLANDGKAQLDLWSRQLMRISRRELAVDGDVQKALEGLGKIPPTSAVYPDAQAMIEKWQKQWATGEENSAAFQAALKSASWFNASLYLSRVGSLQSKYWSRTQYDKLSAQLAREQDGWERYQEAESLALSGDMEDYKRKSFHKFIGGKRPDEKAESGDYTDDPKALAKAIAIGGEVKKDTYIYSNVQRKRELWNQRIAEIAADKYQGKDFAGSIAAARLVPKGSAAYAQAQKWQRLSQAQVPNNSNDDADIKLPRAKRGA